LGKIKDHSPPIIKADSKEGLKNARDVIFSGGLVAFPTESFYGLAVNATNTKAIWKMYNIKKRPANRPILALIPSVDQLNQYVSHIPEIAFSLIDQFWPGGLTLVLKAGKNISPALTGNTGKIGIRLSSHPIATALARQVGLPVTGTSANISGHSPCMDAMEVFHSLGNQVDLILDGGKTKGGKGSTILDVTVTPPLILREGIIDRKELKNFLHRNP